MKNTALLFVLTISAAIGESTLSATGHNCSDAITQTGRNQLLSVSESDRRAYLYRNICKGESSAAGIDLGVVKLSLGVSYSSKEEYCEAEKMENESHHFDYLRTSTVVEPALRAWLECIRLGNEGIRMTPDVQPTRLVLTLERTSAVKGIVRGVRPTAGTICSAILAKRNRTLGPSINYKLPTDEKWTIVCDRQSIESRAVPGAILYPETTVTLDTSQGGFSITLPEEPVATETWARDLLGAVEEVRQEVRGEVARIRVSPGKGEFKSWSGEQGGANPILRVAECPPGSVAVGIEMSLGGTCQTKCHLDGRPVHKFRLKCAPRLLP